MSRMTRRASRLIACLIFLLLFPAVGLGQNTAELQGRLVDPTGRPVISAFIIITSQDTALIRAATSDDSGEFKFSSLPVGSYSLQVKADGYVDLRAYDVRANIGKVVRLDISLAVNDSHTASLRGMGAPMIETSNTQLGVVMDDISVTELPLKSRDTFELLQLQSGVQSTLGADLFFGSDQPGVVSVNGGRARANNYNVNGGHSGDQFVNAPSIQPSPDTIAEFRVISHNYDADLGRNSGSVLNEITKSGSDALHGSACEYFRNTAPNHKGYLDPGTPDFKQNEFGGTLGGPVRRDKTFFFSSYEGRRVRNGVTYDSVTVPTTQERSGNFSAGQPFTGVLQDATVATELNTRPG